jgi:deoxyribodipyrimidine photolyase-related protein
MEKGIRNLVVVLGDQLDHGSAAFDGFDPRLDAVWMAEVKEEATHVWAHKLRIAFFFSAMRHFRAELEENGLRVRYHALTADDARDRGSSFAEVLRGDVGDLQPERLVVVMPGDYRVLTSLREEARTLGVELEIRPDSSFYCDIDEFAEYARGRKRLRLEQFYRHMRKEYGVLLDDAGEPAGGRWNFDADNRDSLKSRGAGDIPKPLTFRPDGATSEVIRLVEARFGHHPGALDHFGLPVTRSQARALLDDFIGRRLRDFGTYEDAMWTDEPFLFHSWLSAPLNTKMLSPRECVQAAVDAYGHGEAPINSVEGFVRQILGWREYVRGIYWSNMPDYASMNYLDHHLEVPSFFWDGNTDMECVRQTMRHVIELGYSHHIPRLMVMGNLAMTLGVHPHRFHEWHMAMYVDAIDWVSLPNTLGMSQFGDGGIMGSKPYSSTGRYIDRMSNFCARCRYDPEKSTGDDACPFTTLYWDFLDRHYDRLKGNPRLAIQLKNVKRAGMAGERLDAIRARAAQLRRDWLGA